MKIKELISMLQEIESKYGEDIEVMSENDCEREQIFAVYVDDVFVDETPVAYIY